MFGYIFGAIRGERLAYAGTWQHGDGGGQMPGRIEKQTRTDW